MTKTQQTTFFADKPLNASIDNVGPITHLSLEFLPGVNRLTGVNGAGKTTAANAITQALGGKGSAAVTTRDGAPQGKVTVDGLILKVGGRSTRTGATEVALGNYGVVAEIVDPGIQDPVKADAARIRAILGVVDLPVTKEVMQDLAAGDEALIPETLPSNILDAADHVRLTAHKHAKAIENEVSMLDGMIVALDERLHAVPQSDSTEDVAAAASTASALTTAAARMRLLAEQRVAHEAQVAKIRESLGEKPNTEQATALVDAAEKQWEASRDAAEKAEEALRVAKDALGVCRVRLEALQKDATRTQDAQTRWEQQRALMDTPVSGPTVAEATAAEAAAGEATGRAEKAAWGAERRGLMAKATAESEKRTAKQNAMLALRSIATGCSARLGDLLAKHGVPGVTVEDGRLLVGPPEKRVLFAERLSLGQKVRFALSVVGPGFVPLDPGFWASLQPSVKAQVHKAAVEKGIYLVTEEPSDTAGIVVQHGVG